MNSPPILPSAVIRFLLSGARVNENRASRLSALLYRSRRDFHLLPRSIIPVNLHLVCFDIFAPNGIQYFRLMLWIGSGAKVYMTESFLVAIGYNSNRSKDAPFTLIEPIVPASGRVSGERRLPRPLYDSDRLAAVGQRGKLCAIHARKRD